MFSTTAGRGWRSSAPRCCRPSWPFPATSADTWNTSSSPMAMLRWDTSNSPTCSSGARRRAIRRLPGPGTKPRSGCTPPAAPASEGLRPPAPRHGRVHRAVRARRPGHHASATAASAWPSCSSRTASATGLYFPFARRRDDDPVARARRRRPNVFDGHRAPPADAVLLGADQLRDAAGASARRARLRSVGIRWASRPARRCRPRSSSASRQRFGVEILDGIGSTEILHIFISNRPGAIRPGSSGRLGARLRGEASSTTTARRCRAARSATCWSAATRPARSYWNKHEKTKDTIEGHWIRTGDKYHQDEDGFFWYAGRSDDMLKVGGIWVSPVEVENTLMEHAAVLECAVVGARGSRSAGQARGATWCSAAGCGDRRSLTQELQQFVRARLAEYKRPRWVEFVAELPKTATGKTQRFRLRRHE